MFLSQPRIRTQHRFLGRSLFVLFLGLCFVMIGGLRTVQAAAMRQSSNGPTIDDLRNATYRSLSTDSGFVTLTDGVYDDADSELHVTLTDFYAFGDINGDGVDDAIAVLATSSGGDAVFYDLVGLVSDAGDFSAAGVVLLGDRVRVNEVAIVNGDVVVDYARRGPNDPVCCPTQHARGLFALRRNLLVPKLNQAFGVLIPVQDGELYGYINVLGETVIEPQFALAGEFSEGLAAVSYDGRTTGFINQLGEMVIDAKFAYAGPFQQGMAIAGVAGVDVDKPFLSAYIDRDGRFVFGDARFVSAEPFGEGLAAVSLDGEHFGFIDLLGQMVIEPQFDRAEQFSEGLAPVSVGEQYGFIDRTGSLIIPPQFEAAEPFQGGRAQIALAGKTGYINHRGDVVIEPIYDYGSDFHEGRALVSLDGKLAYIDEVGNVEIDLPNLTAGSDFAEGLAAVNLDGQFGYIDLQGRTVIAPQFTFAGSFQNGLALYETATERGVINNIGEVVLQMPKFERMSETTTEVVEYVPSVPAEVREGSCSAHSDVLAITSAWQCRVDNETYDPCLLGEDGESLVCEAAPGLNAVRFRLELTEPLPQAKVSAQPPSPFWQLRTSDGALCVLFTASELTVDGQQVTHVCDDNQVILGGVDQSVEPWTVQKAALQNDEEGNFSIDTTATVEVITAWQAAVPE